MTAIARPRPRGVVVVHVAVCAGNLGMKAGQRKRRVVVIEAPIRPSHCVMAHLAGGWETRRDVVHRGGRSVVVLEVTTGARCAGELVISIHVTLCALQRGMCTREGESRRNVIEGSSQPGSSGVAGIARRRISQLHVIGILNPLIVRKVTSNTGAAGEAVISIHVTL